ncbi:MAG: hypothetical protein ACXWM5_16240 [Vulcanimicrobiaceae bacterium]
MIGKDRAIKLLAISIGSADFSSAPLGLNRNMLFAEASISSAISPSCWPWYQFSLTPIRFIGGARWRQNILLAYVWSPVLFP